MLIFLASMHLSLACISQGVYLSVRLMSVSLRGVHLIESCISQAVHLKDVHLMSVFLSQASVAGLYLISIS
jgi:hypothetical protein